MAKKSHRGKGEGCISQRPDGSWRAYVTIDGNRIHYSAKTKAECQEWIRMTLNQISDGYSYDGMRTILSEYLTGWLKTKKEETRFNTHKEYVRYCQKDIIPVMGTNKLKDLTLGKINHYYKWLSENGRKIPTIEHIHRVLHAALADAVKLGYISQNPSQGATIPKGENQESLTALPLIEFEQMKKSGRDPFKENFLVQKFKVWTEQELEKFLFTATKSPKYALCDLVAQTGMRSGEIRGLLITDVELHDTYADINVCRQIQWNKEKKWVMVFPKTEAGVRKLRVGANTALALKKHLEDLELIKLANKNRWKEYGLLFPSSVGTPICQSNLRKEFNRIIENAGIRQIRFHDVRHTVASILLNHGVPIFIVSKILGHSKPSVTSDTYYHMSHMEIDRVSDCMDVFTPSQTYLETALFDSMVILK